MSWLVDHRGRVSIVQNNAEPERKSLADDIRKTGSVHLEQSNFAMSITLDALRVRASALAAVFYIIADRDPEHIAILDIGSADTIRVAKGARQAYQILDEMSQRGKVPSENARMGISGSSVRSDHAAAC
jgi:hypothetical protein